MRSEISGASGYELKIISGVFELLGMLFRNHKKNPYTRQDAEILMSKRWQFADVFAFIEKNHTRPISLSNAAAVAHMSEGHFCRMFRQNTGRTLTDYVPADRERHFAAKSRHM